MNKYLFRPAPDDRESPFSHFTTAISIKSDIYRSAKWNYKIIAKYERDA